MGNYGDIIERGLRGDKRKKFQLRVKRNKEDRKWRERYENLREPKEFFEDKER